MLTHTMHLPGIGDFTRDDEFGWYYGPPVSIRVLGGQSGRLVLVDYDEDEQRDDFRIAADNFLSADPKVLAEVSADVFQYYQDCKPDCSPDLEIEQPADVWRHVQLGKEPMVGRGSGTDQKMYVSLECNCDWEPEHGLQIVFAEGSKVSKIGGYDGHMTNANAYADPSLVGVIYHRSL